MMNTLSLLPINTAHPPLVGNTARTCTSITVLFTSERYPQGRERQATLCSRFAVRSAAPACLERARCASHRDAATVVSQREGRHPWLRDRKNFREILVRRLACSTR